MPTFRIRVVDSEGAQRQIEADADQRDALVRDLQSKGNTILSVQEVAAGSVEAAATPARAATAADGNTSLSREELMLFTSQMSALQEAGLPLVKILQIIRKRMHSKFANVLDEISRNIQSGGRFSDALASYPRIFDDLYVNLVRVGEASGRLAQIMANLATILDKECGVMRRVRSAMVYPLFILLFTVALCWGIVCFLMPLFAPMFSSSGMDIATRYPLTYWLMNLSAFMNHPMTIVAGLILCTAAFFGLRAWRESATGRLLLDRLALSLPIYNVLIRNAAVARLSRTLSLLMESGMPLVQALTMLSSTSGNAVISQAVERTARQVSNGVKLSEVFEAERKVFPDLMIQMVQVGEEAGALPQMLGRSADYFEAQLDASISRLLAFLEPAMMMVVGVIVCLFIMAVVLPILGMAQLH